MSGQKITMSEEMKREWHLDRKVTLGLILAILANAGSSVWWAASLNQQVLNHQKSIDAHSQTISGVLSSQSSIGERLAKMEAGINYQTKVLDRIEDVVKERVK